MSPDEAALIRLWKEKRGEAEPEDLSGNLVVQLGLATEALNQTWYNFLVDGRCRRGTIRLGRRSKAAPPPHYGTAIRLLDKGAQQFVASQPCGVCGGTPAEAHHIHFAQPMRSVEA